MTHSVALITGATSGIGEATVRTLARRGVNVVVSGRRLRGAVFCLLSGLGR